MIENEINKIERALDIKLPEYYKNVMLNYPFIEDKETINWSLWDKSEEIIEWTKKYQSGYSRGPKWEHHMLLIGSEHDACPLMLNLKNGIVIKTNHGCIDIEPLEEYDSFESYVTYLLSVYDD